MDKPENALSLLTISQSCFSIRESLSEPQVFVSRCWNFWLFQHRRLCDKTESKWGPVWSFFSGLLPPLPLHNLWPARRNQGSEKWVKLVWKPWIEPGQQALQITQKSTTAVWKQHKLYEASVFSTAAPRLALTLTLWAKLLYKHYHHIKMC